MANVRKFLDLSTAHLDAPSRHWLTQEAMGGGSTFAGCFGWFTAAYPDPDNEGHTTEDSDRPAVLHAILEYACQHGCDYVLFDGDAEENDELPMFDEAEGA